MKQAWYNRIGKKRWQLYLAAALAGVLTAALAIGVVAVFTNSLHAQRTIAAYDTTGARFSSNYLLGGYTKDNERTLFTTDANVPVSGLVTVCNYPQGRQTLYYQDNISYTIEARLVRWDDAQEDYLPVDASYITNNDLSDYTIAFSDGANTTTLGGSTLSHSFSNSFNGLTGRSDSYSVIFSANFAQNQPNLYLEMIATPTAATPMPTLRGVFKAGVRAAGASNYWTGNFRDKNKVPTAYDGYNYLITGTGEGTVTLTWDAEKIRISDVSLSALLAAGATREGNALTFAVDSDDESRYDLQFYPVAITTEDDWSHMESDVVTFAFS